MPNDRMYYRRLPVLPIASWTSEDALPTAGLTYEFVQPPGELIWNDVDTHVVTVNANEEYDNRPDAESLRLYSEEGLRRYREYEAAYREHMEAHMRAIIYGKPMVDNKEFSILKNTKIKKSHLPDWW